MMREGKIIFVQVILLCLFSLSSVYGQIWKFDFEPNGVTPEAGYTHVDENTLYSAGQGYGIYTTPGKESEAKWATDRGSASPYGLYKDFVAMGNFREFRIDLPNGDYFVTVGSGDASYVTLERIYMGAMTGVTYGWNFGTGNEPVGAPIYLVQHTPFTADMEQIAIPNSSWRDAGTNIVRILGYNTSIYTDEDSKKMEFLLLDKMLVTVTDSQLFVENEWGTGNRLNFLEIMPANCASLIEAGYGLQGDINADCAVDFTDFTTVAANWLGCNDPNDNSCTKNW